MKTLNEICSELAAIENTKTLNLNRLEINQLKFRHKLLTDAMCYLETEPTFEFIKNQIELIEIKIAKAKELHPGKPRAKALRETNQTHLDYQYRLLKYIAGQ